MTAFYLLRHAKAKTREEWTEPDHLRPLTKAGWRQAEALVELDPDRDLAHLLASPYLRCVQSLEPLAKARGLQVERVEELAEVRRSGPPTSSLGRSRRTGPHCTHGDVVQNVLVNLQRRSVPLEGPPQLRKGSTWVLEATIPPP